MQMLHQTARDRRAHVGDAAQEFDGAQALDSARRTRVLRGIAGTLIVTVFAAASHSIGGGEITWLALVATAILALPICVALAGRVASLWRLVVAVSTAQFLYHWSFAGLGGDYRPAGSEALPGALPVPAHHAHHAAMFDFVPDASPATFGALMWASHAVAAALTVALLYRGERAAQSLLHVLQRIVFARPAARSCDLTLQRVRPAGSFRLPQFSSRLFTAGAITHRGPPALMLAA